MTTWRVTLALCLSGLFSPLLHAQPQAAQEFQHFLAAVRQATTAGPADVPLAGKGVLKLPPDHWFAPQPQAGRLLLSSGRAGNDPSLLGLIVAAGAQHRIMTVHYVDLGHIHDEDARDWDADDLLKSYRAGAAAVNQGRQQAGVVPMEIVGWAEKPSYDAAAHRLAWAVATREQGAAADGSQSVHCSALLLGREGYFMINLATTLDELPAGRTAAQAMLAALAFDEGQRYADFDRRTDRSAEDNLEALKMGVTARKLGYVGAVGLFVAEYPKLVVVGLVVLVVGAVGFFRRGLLGLRRLRGPGAAAPPAA